MLHLMRTLHVLGGVIWVGTMVFMSLYLLPTARALGPTAGPFLNHVMQVRKLPVYMLSIGLVTVLTGYWFYWHNAVTFGNEWLASGQGRVFGIGAVLATIGWLIGFFVNKPTAQKISVIASQMAQSGSPPTPEMMGTLGALQAKLGKASLLITVLLVGATIAMAVARYTS